MRAGIPKAGQGEGLLYTNSNSVGLGWSLRFYIPNYLPGDGSHFEHKASIVEKSLSKSDGLGFEPHLCHGLVVQP